MTATATAAAIKPTTTLRIRILWPAVPACSRAGSAARSPARAVVTLPPIAVEAETTRWQVIVR